MFGDGGDPRRAGFFIKNDIDASWRSFVASCA